MSSSETMACSHYSIHDEVQSTIRMFVKVLLFRPPGTLWVPAFVGVAEVFTPTAARPAAEAAG